MFKAAALKLQVPLPDCVFLSPCLTHRKSSLELVTALAQGHLTNELGFGHRPSGPRVSAANYANVNTDLFPVVKITLLVSIDAVLTVYQALL